MNNKDILEKTLQRAIDRGWTDTRQFEVSEDARSVTLSMPVNGNGLLRPFVFDTKVIIYDHAFAKAIWGEETEALYAEDVSKVWGNGDWLLDGDAIVYALPAWKFHLQCMVIADDPVAYLGEHTADN